MSKRKGQTNGSTTRNQVSPAASGNAPEIDAAGTTQSADVPAVDTASFVAGSDGVNGAADGKGLSDGGRQELPGLEAGEGATPGADTKTADTAVESVSVDLDTGSGTGSIENDSDASADGVEDHRQDGSISGEGNDKAGSVGGGNPASGDDGREVDEGDTEAHSRLQRRNGRLYLHDDGAGKSTIDTDSVAGLSDDLKAALELAGCETPEDLVDMARIGSNLIVAIDDIRRCDGPFNSWQPMDDPTEIVHDLYAALEHAWEKAAAAPADPEGKPISSEAPPYIDCCPVCAVPFKPGDVCATDIEMGTCHAECLAGTPVVDLETGEPSGGPVDTFLYSDCVASDTDGKGSNRPWWLEVPNFCSAHSDPLDIAHFTATDVFCGVHGSIDVFGVTIHGGEPLQAPAISREAVSELVDLVRQIGPRATPEVMAQHMVIRKHRQSAELTKAEELGLKAFASILIDLDDFAAAEKKRLEDLSAEQPKPRPVPIDETNMELVDEPMATH